jgi:hypothetical protein
MRILLLLLTGAALLLACEVHASPAAEAGKPTPVLQYEDRIWGDILCGGQIDAADAIPVLAWVGGFDSPAPSQGCPNVALGIAVEGFAGEWRWGDVNCSGGFASPLDALAILSAAAALTPAQSPACPTIGETYSVAILGK